MVSPKRDRHITATGKRFLGLPLILLDAVSVGSGGSRYLYREPQVTIQLVFLASGGLLPIWRRFINHAHNNPLSDLSQLRSVPGFRPVNQ
jgi:hypothetical protein